MTRVNGLYQRLKRGIAFLLALILTVQPFFSFDMGLFPAIAAETEGRGNTFAYYNTSNLLKPGASFPFYGKNHSRVGLWPYGITNVEGGLPAPGKSFGMRCLPPVILRDTRPEWGKLDRGIIFSVHPDGKTGTVFSTG